MAMKNMFLKYINSVSHESYISNNCFLCHFNMTNMIKHDKRSGTVNYSCYFCPLYDHTYKERDDTTCLNGKYDDFRHYVHGNNKNIKKAIEIAIEIAELPIVTDRGV